MFAEFVAILREMFHELLMSFKLLLAHFHQLLKNFTTALA